MAFTIQTVSFAEIFPTWQTKLWPRRESAIESNSAMQWLGGIDMSLMTMHATFWKVGDAVLSGHFGGIVDGVRSFRTRGLWVPENMRRQGVAKALMAAAFQQARIEKCEAIWTYPRKSAMPFYESQGFTRVGEWVDENCYAIARL